MPETFGKRQRQGVKAKKAADRDARRVARNQRREARATGDVDPLDTSWLTDPPNLDEIRPANAED